MNYSVPSVTASKRAEQPSAVAVRSIALVTLLLGACGELPGDGLGTVQGAIDNGDNETDSNAVQVVAKMKDGSTVIGSGFLLDNQTVITAAHLVYDFADNHAVPSSRVQVFQADAATGTPSQPAFLVRSVITHPTFVKDGGQVTSDVVFANQVFDIAVLKLRGSDAADNHLPSVGKRKLTLHTDVNELTAANVLKVIGFGPDPTNGKAAARRSFRPGASTTSTPNGDGPTILAAAASGTQQHVVAPQDTGGPVLDGSGNLAGIAMSQAGAVSNLIFLTTRLQTWIDLVSEAAIPESNACRTRRAARPSAAAGHGRIADDYLVKDLGNSFEFHIEYGEIGIPPPVALPISKPIPDSTQVDCGTASSLAFADVDNDGTPDIIAHTKGTAATGGHAVAAKITINAAGAAPPKLSDPSINFELPAGELFGGFENVAFDGPGGTRGIGGIAKNGREYLFGITGNGPYKVGHTGQQLCTPLSATCLPHLFYGFPTADGTDGKFVVTVGDGQGTVTRTFMNFLIALPQSEGQLRVDIFDADVGGIQDAAVGGINDDGTGNTCFRLVPLTGTPSIVGGSLVCPAQDATSKTECIAATNDAFEDGSWKNFFNHDAVALNEVPLSGSYYYRLNVQLGDDCTNTSDTAGLANRFKIRSNGKRPARSRSSAVTGMVTSRRTRAGPLAITTTMASSRSTSTWR